LLPFPARLLPLSELGPALHKGATHATYTSNNLNQIDTEGAVPRHGNGLGSAVALSDENGDIVEGN